MKKRCSKCKESYEITNFYKCKVSKDGYDSYCKSCRYSHTKSRLKIRNEKRKRRMKTDPEYRENQLKQKRKSFKKNIEQTILARTRYRAQLKGYDFNLAKEDIIIPEYCPILGVKIIIGDKTNYEYSPSIDRIDNSKGYIKGNIQIISKKANSMKNSATFEELLKFASWIQNKVKI